MDLPVWQALYEELAEEDFVVLAVSFDTRAPEASRPWIEAANLTYPCLLDIEHVVADLYNMVNVPNAVWVDEEGRIVRPTETAGTGDEFRSMVAPGGIPPDDLQRMMTRRQRYIDAVKDWVRNGAASPHVWSPAEARTKARQRAHTADDALAFAHFRFGTWLARQGGRDDEAQAQLAEAKRLKPDSWAFRRQSWELEEVGKAGGPEFWAAVEALGEHAYYPAPDMAGLDD
jgi:alkyl hydroperoxide reductase subunit AhpC